MTIHLNPDGRPVKTARNAAYMIKGDDLSKYRVYRWHKDGWQRIGTDTLSTELGARRAVAMIAADEKAGEESV